MPIDPLWKSEAFRKAFTGAYGIDSRIEPLINEDEAFYLNEAAKLMAEGKTTRCDRKTDRIRSLREKCGPAFYPGKFLL